MLSIITTTGFASVDFQLWNDQAKAMLLGLMFIGGCAGSAAGGPKVVRHLLLARYHAAGTAPNACTRGRSCRSSSAAASSRRTIMQGVIVFFLFYMLTFAICSAIVILMGADLVTGISATAAALGNVGPGFNQVGPMAQLRGPASGQPRRADASRCGSAGSR